MLLICFKNFKTYFIQQQISWEFIKADKIMSSCRLESCTYDARTTLRCCFGLDALSGIEQIASKYLYCTFSMDVNIQTVHGLRRTTPASCRTWSHDTVTTINKCGCKKHLANPMMHLVRTSHYIPNGNGTKPPP